MGDYVIVDGDTVLFHPGFLGASVTVLPGKMVGTGTESVNGKKICVEGDEQLVRVTCQYMCAPFVIPGTGSLEIAQLGLTHLARTTRIGGKRPIVKGGTFIARFRVMARAMMPPNMVPDPTPEYSGTGMFMTTNVTRMAD